LKHESLKNIGFDSDAALNFDGFTGPYILYTIARINSILKKTKKCLWFGACLKTLVEPEEKEILLLLSQYPQAILKAFQNYNPSVMAKYCFDLSQKFNDFYSKHSVLNASSAKLIKSRLILCRSVSLTLSMALGLLSIDNVEEM
jgi:arginyl-tRNA synthetase